MTRTYRKGKGKLIKNINQEPTAYFWRHDHPRDRKALNKEHRHQNRQYFKKFGETLPYFKSRGWETW